MASFTVRISPTKAEWDTALAAFPEANFLQSWQWGEFQSRLHKNTERLIVYSDDKVVSAAQMVIEEAKRGTYAALAGGPLLQWKDLQLVQYTFAQLKRVAAEHNCWFIRFRPQSLKTAVPQVALTEIKAQLAPMHLTADLTLQLDITQSEDVLLQGMRKNTRGEIRKAERLGITTKLSTDAHELRRFYEQQLAVAEKHHFVPFSYAFLYEQFLVFSQQNAAFLIHAYHDDQLLATAFIICFNGEAVYHYGISTDANAKLPGAAAAQWAAILESKRRGLQRYNFWGIAPEDLKQHRFAGVSLFKRGFGGEEVAYLPAHDVPLTPLYWISWVFEQVRRKLRKL